MAGGTGALGVAVVDELLRSGRRVWATWVADAERGRLGGRENLTLVRADLFDPDQAEAAVAAVEDLDAVVNLVGGFKSGPRIHETGPDDLDAMLRLNLRPAFLLARAALPRLAEREGAFVCVSARAALRPFPGGVTYATAKAAVLGFIKALDAEWRATGVRCNAILPSVIDTPANRAASPDADHGTWVPPEEIAKVVRFLVSRDAAVTSGAAIPVYGRA